VKLAISLCCWIIRISNSWRCSSNQFSVSFHYCSMSAAWLLLFSMIVWVLFFCEFLNSINIFFISDFILLSSVSSFVRTIACDAIYIVSEFSGRRSTSGIGSIIAPEPFLLFRRLGGSRDKISYEVWDGLSPCLSGVRGG
jgi:hypothetical protein